jgi:hypothetical protein
VIAEPWLPPTPLLLPEIAAFTSFYPNVTKKRSEHEREKQFLTGLLNLYGHGNFFMIAPIITHESTLYSSRHYSLN